MRRSRVAWAVYLLDSFVAGGIAASGIGELAFSSDLGERVKTSGDGSATGLVRLGFYNGQAVDNHHRQLGLWARPFPLEGAPPRLAG
jgi:hypothetical protein